MGDTAVIQQFRSALGGFNRQDVQQYIEQAAAAHRREEEGLRAKLDEAERRAAELESARDELLRGRQAAEEELARARAELERAGEDAAKLRGALSQSDSKLSVGRMELERLKKRLGELEPVAASYEQLKDRVATVELEAHRKAQDTMNKALAEAELARTDARRTRDKAREDGARTLAQARREAEQTLSQARQEAGQLREETKNWLEGVLAQYGQLRQGIDGAMEQAGAAARKLDALEESAAGLRKLGGLT